MYWVYWFDKDAISHVRLLTSQGCEGLFWSRLRCQICTGSRKPTLSKVCFHSCPNLKLTLTVFCFPGLLTVSPHFSPVVWILAHGCCVKLVFTPCPVFSSTPPLLKMPFYSTCHWSSNHSTLPTSSTSTDSDWCIDSVLRKLLLLNRWGHFGLN